MTFLPDSLSGELSVEGDCDFAVGTMESETVPLPNIVLIGLLLFVTEEVEPRLLSGLLIFESPLSSPFTGLGTDEVELAVITESPDLVLKASRLPGEDDRETEGELQERLAKLTRDSDTERVRVGACKASPATGGCDDSLSSIISEECWKEEMVIRGVSAPGSKVPLICSEFWLLHSCLTICESEF